ncbi:MAG TPA: ABC transporter permease subunit [Bryobacteraceae bacterium]|nr:ABC transporter permease subunit [Bryobacteraceae bacterium]
MAPGFFSVHAKPGRAATLVLSWLFFGGCIAAYLNISATRHRENPEDRVTPTFTQMGEGLVNSVLKPAEEDDTGAVPGSFGERIMSSMLWKDTIATARRFAISMALLIPAVLLGLHMGLFPYVGALFLRFILFFDKIVALSLLPILFIAFGIDELSKIMLIVVGVAPTIILDTFNLTRGVPGEQVVKAFTLGANDFDVAYRVVLKQVFPRVLNSIRINLKAVMLFLFAGEMIASNDGLAFRIALLRRHMGMDVIIPYVLWVALLLFLTDFAMRRVNSWLHPWFREA